MKLIDMCNSECWSKVAPCPGAEASYMETEKRLLMQAVTTLRLENACLVDAVSTRTSEIEELR